MLRSLSSTALVAPGLALLAAACGGLASQGSGSSPSDASDAPATDGGPPCATWTASAPVVVSTPPIPSLAWLGSLSVVGSGALALWASPGEGTVIQARAVGFDGKPTGPVKSPMFDTSGTPNLASFSIAATAGRAASAFSDTATGCSFVRIDATGAALGKQSVAVAAPCADLRATVSGYDVLLAPASGEMSLQPLSESGAAVGKATPIGVSSSLFVARASRPDGSFLVLSAPPPCGLCNGVTVRAFAADGTPLGTAKELGHGVSAVDGPRMAAAAMGDGWLVVWDDAGTVMGATVAADGTASGVPVTILRSDRVWYESIALAAAPGGALLAWIEGSAGQSPKQFRGDLHALPIAGGSLATGSAMALVTSGTFGASLHVVGTPSGALVGFDTGEAVMPGTVDVVPLTCR